MEDGPSLRCPICDVGVLADIGFDRDPSRPQAPPEQTAETTELTTYSCGHEVAGRSRASADAAALDVERRRSQDTVTPPVGR